MAATTAATSSPEPANRQRATAARKRPLPSYSYYDPAFTYPYYGGAQYSQFPVPPYGSGTATGAGTTETNRAAGGDVVHPRIDVNSIFF